MTVFDSATLEIELTAGVWTDFTDRIDYSASPVRIRHGRTTQFDEVGPAVMVLALANYDGNLMPDNPSATWYPDLSEGKRIRYKVTKGATTYTRFTGWIQTLEPSFPDSHTAKAIVSITAIDGLGLLEQRRMRGTPTETALWFARATPLEADAWEWQPSATGINPFPARRSSNPSAAVPAQGRILSADWPDLQFSGPDSDITGEGQVSASCDDNGNSNRVFFDLTISALATLQFHMKCPSSSITGSSKWPTITLETAGGASKVLNLSAGVNGASNGYWVMDGANTTSLGIVANLPFGQWVNVVLTVNAGTPTSTDVVVVRADGSLTGVTAAVDIRTVRRIVIPGDVTPLWSVAWGPITALSGNGIPFRSWWTGATGDTTGTQTVLTRAQHLCSMAGDLPITFAGAGTGSTSLATTGTTAGRTALECIQEAMRTGRGMLWARPWDGTVLRCWTDIGLRGDTPVATIDLDADCDGAPRLARGADQQPTRVEVEWPGGKETAINAAAELALGGASRTKTVSSVAGSAPLALALAQAILGDAVTGTRIAQLSVDLSGGATDHTAALFSEAGTIGGLFPLSRIRTLVPSAFFGVPVRDHWVQGWEESHHPDQTTVVMDTVPALATLAYESWTASNGQPWPSQWTASIGTGGGSGISARTATVAESASATSITGTLPADIQSGDCAVAVFSMSSTVAQFTAPSGWTQLAAPTIVATSKLVAAYYRFSPPSAPVGTTSGAADRQTAIVQAYSGVNTGTPVDVAAQITSGTGTSLALTGVTTATAGARLLSGVTADTASRAWVIPSGMTEVKQYSASTTGRAGALADEVRTTAGATGTRTWSLSPSASLGIVGFTVALRPAAATATMDVQSNRGRIVVDSAGTMTGVRLPSAWASIEVTALTQVVSAAEARIYWRADSTAANGYFLSVSASGGVAVKKVTAGVTSTVATLSGTITAATDYRVRVRHQGSYLNVKFWAASGAEPGAWGLATTDSSFTAAGYVALAGAGASQTVYFDDFTLTSGG